MPNAILHLKGVARRRLAGILLLGLPLANLTAAAHAQITAEVFASPPNTIPELRARFFDGRYELRNATMIDLISTAWGIPSEDVVGGPEWLDLDRFDVIATAPPDSTAPILATMLRTLLTERFALTVHTAQRDQPAYVITAGRKPNLSPVDGSETPGCSPDQTVDPRSVPLEPVTFSCRNMTMAALAKKLPELRESEKRPDPATSGYLFNYPVIDRTGLTGAWNFSFRWLPRHAFLPAVLPRDTITLFDAFEKQLGLKLQMTQVPHTVIVVDSAKRPQLSDAPHAARQFEVAAIRQDDPDDRSLRCGYMDIQPGGRVRIDMTLRELILETQGEWNSHRIIGGPPSMDTICWHVEAKAPVPGKAPPGWSGPSLNGLDIDDMRQMLRSLLADRFKLLAHTEDRPVSGYALVAAKPKLKKAESANRPACREGPAADGKDPRLINPLIPILITCRNMTLSQLAAAMNRWPRGPGGPVVDATHIEGRYDLTVNFSPLADIPKPEVTATGEVAASEPNGAVSIFDAFRRQLGLKLENREVPAPVLVIDYLEEKPQQN